MEGGFQAALLKSCFLGKKAQRGGATVITNLPSSQTRLGTDCAAAGRSHLSGTRVLQRQVHRRLQMPLPGCPAQPPTILMGLTGGDPGVYVSKRTPRRATGLDWPPDPLGGALAPGGSRLGHSWKEESTPDVGRKRRRSAVTPLS